MRSTGTSATRAGTCAGHPRIRPAGSCRSPRRLRAEGSALEEHPHPDRKPYELPHPLSAAGHAVEGTHGPEHRRRGECEVRTAAEQRAEGQWPQQILGSQSGREEQENEKQEQAGARELAAAEPEG